MMMQSVALVAETVPPLIQHPETIPTVNAELMIFVFETVPPQLKLPPEMNPFRNVTFAASETVSA